MRILVAAALDALAIAAFAAIGRASHDESIAPLAVAQTAWPFWAGAAAGWLVSRSWRRPSSPVLGVGVWAATTIGGVALRAATGAGVPVSFVVVTALVLAVLLLGWRGLAGLLARQRAGRAATYSQS